VTSALQAADSAARLVALTALDRTLLVEAGAGSGKTSVLAGRVTSLLAAGRHPREIAAITFTELAAGELRERISR
jgi:CRISPR-associated exonuclease Cas4